MMETPCTPIEVGRLEFKYVLGREIDFRHR